MMSYFLCVTQSNIHKHCALKKSLDFDWNFNSKSSCSTHDTTDDKVVGWLSAPAAIQIKKELNNL